MVCTNEGYRYLVTLEQVSTGFHNFCYMSHSSCSKTIKPSGVINNMHFLLPGGADGGKALRSLANILEVSIQLHRKCSTY